MCANLEQIQVREVGTGTESWICGTGLGSHNPAAGLRQRPQEPYKDNTGQFGERNIYGCNIR